MVKTDSAFLKEEKHLEMDKKAILGEMNDKNKEVKDLNLEIDANPGGTAENIQVKKRLRAKRDKLNSDIKNYIKWSMCPYFGRLDFKDDSESDEETIYIGKDHIEVNDKVIAISWKAPIAGLYYENKPKSYTLSIGGQINRYTVTLKRTLDIKNGKLEKCFTAFGEDAITLDGEVIDEKLLEIIKEKRNNPKLTDIIMTIQSNQNKIMRSPVDESFILQGCAGSGKTMILLHRISVVLYNNKSIMPQNILILTPNKNFDTFIDELSSQLGLEYVERISIDEYYKTLLNRYEPNGKNDGVVVSEKHLPKELLTRLYSLEFQNKVIADYHNYWDKVLSSIKESSFIPLCDKLDTPKPQLDTHDNNCLRNLKGMAGSAKLRIETNLGEIAKYKERIKDLKSRIAISEEKCERLSSELEDIRQNALKDIAEELDQTNKNVLFFSDSLKMLDENTKNALKESKELDERLWSLRSILLKLQSESANQMSYDHVTTSDTSTCNKIKSVFAKEIAAIELLKASIQKIPSYAFARRNTVTAELNKAMADFEKQCSDYVKDGLEIKEEIKKLTLEKEALDKSIADAQKEADKYKEFIKPHIERKEVLEYCRTILNAEVYTGLSSLPAKVFSKVPSFMKEYERVQTLLSNEKKGIGINKAAMAKDNEELTKLAAAKIEPGDMMIVDEANELIDSLTIKSLAREVLLPGILEAYKSCGAAYKKDIYRYRLYLMLLLYSLFYGKTLLKHTFISIDEAQDISLAEYKMLKGIFSDTAVFNLYGDVNQALYSYKCIGDWTELASLFGENIHVLNENYRNPAPITDYINERFDTGIVSIGLDGKAVEEMALSEAINSIIRYKKDNPEYRCAVITAFDDTDMPVRIKEALATYNLHYSTVLDEKLISVTNVEAIKGLEFEYVVAVVNGMSINEEYIAYTRALDKLVVVKESF